MTYTANNDRDAIRRHRLCGPMGGSHPSPQAIVCVDSGSGRYEIRDVPHSKGQLPEVGDLTSILRDRVPLAAGERLVKIL